MSANPIDLLPPPDVVQLTSAEQIEMGELEDDAALFGAAVGSSSLISSLQPVMPPVVQQYDPTADPCNPAFLG